MPPKDRKVVSTTANRQSISEMITASLLLNSSEKLVFLYYQRKQTAFRRMNKNKAMLTMSDATIAKATGLCVRTVSRAIQKIHKLGFIYKKTRQVERNLRRRVVCIRWKAVYRLLGLIRSKKSKNPFKKGSDTMSDKQPPVCTGGLKKHPPPKKKDHSAASAVDEWLKIEALASLSLFKPNLA